MEQLGFSEKEIKVYFTILKYQRVRVSQITKDTNIKRTSIYYAIDKLLDKNLITVVIQEDKKYYIPEDPKKSLNQLVTEQKNIVDDILPSLKNIIGDDVIHPKIKIYRQKEGIKRMMWTMLDCREKLVRYYLYDPSVEEFVGEKFLNEFTEKRISLEIKVKTFRSLDYKPMREEKKLGSKELREVLYLPKNIKIKPSISIFDDKIVVISPKEKLGFVVQSQDFTDAQKTIFDLLWDSLK